MRLVPGNPDPPTHGTGRAPKYDLSDMKVGQVRAVPYRDSDIIRNWLPNRRRNLKSYNGAYDGWKIITWRVRDPARGQDELYFKRVE